MFRKIWSAISASFFRGLITILPLLITVWLLWILFSFADGVLGKLIELIVGRPLPGVGFLIVIVLIFLTGILTTFIFGEKMILFGERALTKLPIVKSIYMSVKQINDVLFQKRGKGYQRACVVEYPRKGIYTVGFITGEAAKEIEKKTNTKGLVNIFIANTPTPATGFLIAVPAKEVKLLDMRIEDAFKYVVSGGVLKPSKRKK
ncbi:MAG: DUF502 domain-containing protein [Candidatus Saganbacteria bacterium]|nr:DUF502 domain-containing protein [Candidatus Saganbacteria bacterium]